MSLDSLCRLQVQVYVNCTRRKPAHLRCTLCSILLHLINISFLLFICLWQISKIQTCLCVVVGPSFVSTAPTFMRSSDCHPAGLHGRLAQKKLNQAHCWEREVSPRFAQHLAKPDVTAPQLVSCVVWSQYACLI